MGLAGGLSYTFTYNAELRRVSATCSNVGPPTPLYCHLSCTRSSRSLRHALPRRYPMQFAARYDAVVSLLERTVQNGIDARVEGARAAASLVNLPPAGAAFNVLSPQFLVRRAGCRHPRRPCAY